MCTNSIDRIDSEPVVWLMNGRSTLPELLMCVRDSESDIESLDVNFFQTQ